MATNFHSNPAYNMEMTTSSRGGADDVFGADNDTGRSKMVAVTDNPLHESSSARTSPAAAKISGKAHWGAIRSKVQTRIEMRKEETARKGLSKSGRMVTAMLDKLQNEDGSINRRTAELMRALEKREQGYEDTDFFDRLSNELFITGKLLFEMLTPGNTGQGLYLWTSLYTIVNVIVFVYMAADYSWYLYLMALEGNPQICPVESPFKDRYCLPANYHNGTSTVCDDVCTSTVTPYGLRNSTLASDFSIDKSAPERALGWLANFVVPGQSTDENYVLHHFDASYLVSWGGRYIPNINKCDQWYRWLTSLFLHHSAGHLFSNFLLFVALAAILERKYGTWRILAVSLISGIGGNFLSTYMDSNRCLVVVGASGTCYGIFGLFCADMLLNYESIERPILRCSVVIVFLIFNLIMVHSEDGVSHTSHLGGFLCGLFPSFLFLPNFHSERWEAVLPPLGVLTVLIMLIIVPISIYANMKTDLKGFIGEDCMPLYDATTC